MEAEVGRKGGLVILSICRGACLIRQQWILLYMEGEMEAEDMQIQIQKAKRALDSGNHSEAFAWLLPCAEAGSPEAQANIGFLYYMGLGVDRDLHKAIEWLKQAIAQGRSDAAHNLATLYLTCEPELPSRPDEARRLYLKARELGFVVASAEWYEQMRDGDTK